MKLDVICRYPIEGSRKSSSGAKIDSLEKVFHFFLLSSFDSEEVYIISPWVSDFNLSGAINAQPYLSSTSNLIEILDKLSSKGTKIHVLTRCIDEKVNLDLLYAMYVLQLKNPSLPSEIKDFLLEELSSMRNRIFAWIKLKEFSQKKGIDFKVDLGLPIRRYEYARLHSKMYVNDHIAIIGSSNFTRSGVVTGGNWECIIVISSDNNLYSKIREYAINYISKGKNACECEQRVINLVNKLSLDTRVNTMDDLMSLLDRIIFKLESI